ncbi:hypothetical protein [Rothia uropygioeca]|uniref:hypothetical protein n=1 Tax=Kocuria sp. 257 TaxID=2021970 RepID=UPI001012C7DA|nr:hypothetical protein [Kocuria sp. 257]
MMERESTFAAPGPGRVTRIWWAEHPVQPIEAALGNDPGPFGPKFVHRLARTQSQWAQREMVAARLLGRWLLACAHRELHGPGAAGARPADWRVEQRCDRPGCLRREAHGRPIAIVQEWTGPGQRALSWSHHEGRVAAAVGCGVPRLGIDLVVPDGLSVPCAASWSQWARAEALTKAGAGGLQDLLESGTVPDGFDAAFPSVDGVVVALAWKREDAVELRRRRLSG